MRFAEETLMSRFIMRAAPQDQGARLGGDIDLVEVWARAQAMAVRLVSLHRERIFAVARQLYVRGSLDSHAIKHILSGVVEAGEYCAGFDARRACRSGMIVRASPIRRRQT